MRDDLRRKGEVTKDLGDFVLFRMDGDFKSHKVRKEDVEILTFLAPTQVPKTLNLNLGDEAVLFSEFEDICSHDKEGLGPDQILSGDHIKLGWWVIQRDLIEVAGASLVDPIVVYQITHGILDTTVEAQEIVQKAHLILLRQFSKAGILGIPIFAAEHWTLLVLRKVGDKVQVRYYDSLKEENIVSRVVADIILSDFRSSGLKLKFPSAMPAKTHCRSWQINGVDCGVFVLHFWEGEARRFVGEGWSLKFPTTSNKGIICKVRNRLVQLVKQMQKIPAERAKAAAKVKAKAKAAPVRP